MAVGHSVLDAPDARSSATLSRDAIMIVAAGASSAASLLVRIG
jgi:hypothetical protein